MADTVQLLAAGGRSERGGRPSQRDFYSILLPGQISGAGSGKLAFFAVYDGHGSDTVSKHAKKHIPDLLANTPDLRNGDYRGALKAVLRQEEGLLRQHHMLKYGSTVAVCLVDLSTGLLVVGNLGESHILLAEWGHGDQVNVKWLTESHKPSSPSERSRILEAGGVISQDEGIERLGPLSMSRCLGDLALKESFQKHKVLGSQQSENGPLSSEPFIQSIQLQDNLRYHMVLVTDGVTNVIDDKTIMEKIADYWHSGLKAKDISKTITVQVSQRFRSDNATCISVFLKGRMV